MLGVADTTDRGRTPLILAARSGNGYAVALLLMHGANPNVPDELLATPLHYAQTASTVGQLLGAGANPNARNKFGATPLSLCIGEGNYEKAKSLVLSGAKLNVVDKRGWSPLDCALHWQQNLDDPHTGTLGQRHAADWLRRQGALSAHFERSDISLFEAAPADLGLRPPPGAWTAPPAGGAAGLGGPVTTTSSGPTASGDVKRAGTVGDSGTPAAGAAALDDGAAAVGYEERMSLLATKYEAMRAAGDIPGGVGDSAAGSPSAAAGGSAGEARGAGSPSAPQPSAPVAPTAPSGSLEPAGAASAPPPAVLSADAVLDGWIGVVRSSSSPEGVCFALDALRAHCDSGSEIGKRVRSEETRRRLVEAGLERRARGEEQWPSECATRFGALLCAIDEHKLRPVYAPAMPAPAAPPAPVPPAS